VPTGWLASITRTSPGDRAPVAVIRPRACRAASSTSFPPPFPAQLPQESITLRSASSRPSAQENLGLGVVRRPLDKQAFRPENAHESRSTRSMICADAVEFAQSIPPRGLAQKILALRLQAGL
jgi:hypothetical protein